MGSIRIHKELNNQTYFITLVVKRWYYLFDRHNRFFILLDSLNYLVEDKRIEVYSWVFMLNHIHLILSSNDVSGSIRDFKKFTSKKMKKNIIDCEPNILKLFQTEKGFNFWMKTNMPILIESEKFYLQKKRYIEENPVKKYYVLDPSHWYFSSACEPRLIKLSPEENIWFRLQT